ncbi:MAG: zinc ribbon domain-containing protein [Gammaproteobacteria bacterium]|nr:zinc ribbon domain-containing protein [Gammaproteobacteria bacterium]
MPTYVYETIPEDPSTEPRRFELEQRMADEPLSTDPETGLPVRRVISGGVGLLAGIAGGGPTYQPSMGSCCSGGCGCG